MARSTVLRAASEADLLRLERIARRHRSSPGDAEDLALLEAHPLEALGVAVEAIPDFTSERTVQGGDRPRSVPVSQRD